jgi:hypothetical protein
MQVFRISSIVIIFSALFTDNKTFRIVGVDYSLSSEGKLCHLFPLFKYNVFYAVVSFFLFWGGGVLDFFGHLSAYVVHWAW